MKVFGKITEAKLQGERVILTMSFEDGMVDGYLTCKKEYDECRMEEFHVGAKLSIEIDKITD